MLVYLFRKKHPYGFSIEKLFNLLYQHMQQRTAVQRLEMPSGTDGLWTVLTNAWYVRRQHRGRVIHITGDVHYGALLMPFTRTIITVHDCGMLERGRGLKRLVLWLLWFRLPMMFASAVTVISTQTRDELRSVVKLPAHKVHVIPNFIDPRYQHRPLPSISSVCRILHIGTRDNKNLQRVIHAVTGLAVLLIIVGPLDAAHTTLLLQQNINYACHAAPDETELLALYEAADLVSFPSTYEGFGMPILEAQAIGRPVLTSDREPMRSVAGREGALLVDPESITSIRSGFIRLIDDTALRERLIINGLDNVRHYTLHSVAQQYQRLYEQLNA